MGRNRERVRCDGIHWSFVADIGVIWCGGGHGHAWNVEEPAEIIGTEMARKRHESGILGRNKANGQVDMVLLLVEDIVMATTPSQFKAHDRNHLDEDLTADIGAEVWE